MIPSVITFTLAKRKKLSLPLLGFISLLIGVGGVYWAGSMRYGGGRFIILTIGVFSLLVAFFCVYSLIQLAKENDTAIYISDEGIYDVSTGNTYGTIVWTDIEDIRVMDDISELKNKYLVIKVSNPTEYIQRERNMSKRRSLELRFQYYGSPICISNRALNCTFEELRSAVMLKYEQHKKLPETNG